MGTPFLNTPVLSYLDWVGEPRAVDGVGGDVLHEDWLVHHGSPVLFLEILDKYSRRLAIESLESGVSFYPT